MQFSKTLKTKNIIYKKLIKVFNQLKIYIKQNLKYFWNNNIGEYQEFQFIF